MNEGPPRFIADGMLGSLARWLRMLGYDTLYDRDLGDDSIVSISTGEGRVVLTRDRNLAERSSGLLIGSVDLDEQLIAVRERFRISFQEDRTRCSECNGELVTLKPEEAKGRIPENSFAHAKKFWNCASCGKTYWDGTHWKRIMERFREDGLKEEGAE